MKKQSEPSIDDKMAALKASQAAALQKPEAVSQEINIQFHIPITQNFNAKLPILLVIFLLFVFSAVLLDKSNFKISDMLDFSRLSLTLSKFYSLNFIFFLLVFSLTIALSIFYGHGISPLLAMLTLPVSIVASLVLGFLFFKGLILPFIALGVVISSAAFFSSIRKELDWGRIWGVADQALMILVVLTFLVVFMKATTNQQSYSDALVTGLLSYAKNDLPTSTGSSALAVSPDDVEKVLSLDLVKTALPKSDAQKVLESSFGTVVMSDPQYDLLMNGIHGRIVANKKDIADKLNANIASILTPSSAGGSPTDLKSRASQILPVLKPLFDNLPMILALFALLLMSTVTFALKFLSTGFAYAMFKYL